MEQIYTPTLNYKVLVHTITYNQAKYITDTLDGVAMQETNFPFVHYVIDDASTDGEQEVIKSWLNEHCDMDNAEYIDLELANVTLVPHNTNRNLTFAFYLLKRNLWKEPKLKASLVAPWRKHCEYEALCEGDDYWIDSRKLQIQVDFLDSHLDYSMCFHGADLLCAPNITPSIHCDDIEDREYYSNEVFPKWIVPTASIVARRQVMAHEIIDKEKMVNGDIVIVLSSFVLGKVRGFSPHMSVYRVNNEGVNLNPKTLYQRMKRMPEHYDMLETNFPFLNHDVIVNLKAIYYYLIAYHSDDVNITEKYMKKTIHTRSSSRFAVIKLLIRKRMFRHLFSLWIYKS